MVRRGEDNKILIALSNPDFDAIKAEMGRPSQSPLARWTGSSPESESETFLSAVSRIHLAESRNMTAESASTQSRTSLRSAGAACPRSAAGSAAPPFHPSAPHYRPQHLSSE